MVESLQNFYNKINQSVADESTRELWHDYRKSITEFVLESIHPDSTILIVGAGNMNDFEYHRIAELSTQITLADIDSVTLKTVAPEGVICESVDFGCLEMVPSQMSEDDAAVFLKLQQPTVRSSLGNVKYDHILISPFYTQLVLPWVFSKYTDIAPESQLVEAALDLAGRTIRKSNEYIRSLLNDEGIICHWTDILEYETEDPAFHDILKNISDTEWIDAFHAGYIEQYGYGLGGYGHMEMEETLRNSKHKWLIWPLNKSRRLIVRIASGSK